VAYACPDIRRIIFKLSPESDATARSCLPLVEFQKLAHLEMWGGGFRQAQLDQVLEVMGPNLRYRYVYRSCLSLCVVQFQKLAHLDMWGGGFRQAQLDQVL
jgi:ribosome modulation factor